MFLSEVRYYSMGELSVANVDKRIEYMIYIKSRHSLIYPQTHN